MSVDQKGTGKPHPVISERWWLVLATLILLAAASFRLIALNDIPPGLAQDEVLDADIASFIRGGEHALFFRHGYGHEPLYHYLAVPFQVLIGENLLSIRLPSVFLGMLLVAMTMRWARRDYGTVAALVAGTGLAISWWPIIFSRIGIRPVLEPVLLVIGVWFWPLRDVALTRRGVVSAVFAGVFLGLSVYSYTAARVVLLIPLLVGAVQLIQFLWLRRRAGTASARPDITTTQLSYALVVLVTGLAVYTPLALTLQRNPDLQQRLDQLEGPLVALREGDAGPVLQMTAATLGVFSFKGDPRWTYTLPNRPLFDALSALLFYVGLAIALWRWQRARYLLLPVWLLVALLPSALSPDAPSTVRLIGAIPVVYLLPGIAIAEGWRLIRGRSWTTVKTNRLIIGLFVGVLVLVLSTNVYRTIRDGFIRWPQGLETRLRYQSVISDVGRHWLSEASDAPPVVAEVFYEPIDAATLRRAIGQDSRARWIQTGAGVAGGLVWPDGLSGIEGSLLYVPEFAPLHPELIRLIGLGSPEYRSLEHPSFAAYRLPPWPPDSIAPSDLIVSNSTGDQLLTLVGMRPIETSDAGMSFATAWEVQNPLPQDLAFFIHVLAEDGQIVAQYDGLDVAASMLHAGDRFIQRHEILLPSDLASAIYTIQLGAYSRADGQRLVFQGHSDSMEIGTCEPFDGLSLPNCRLTEP